MGLMKRKKNDTAPVPARTVTVSVGGGEARVLAAGDRFGSVSSVEVIFVFDTTGSMYSKLPGLVECTVQMVNELGQVSVPWKVTAVPFGDLEIRGDTINDRLPWLDSVEPARKLLMNLERNAGGGNGGESAFEALDLALRKEGGRSAMRVVVLITDEAAHQKKFSARQMVERVVDEDVLVYSIATHHGYYREMAERTGGSFIPISHSVDASAITEMFRRLGRDIARRSHKVLTAGGSPQALRALEAGR
ncbi:MAG: vWA domain-containing protein [Acidimicrobiales bacterium]